MLKSVRCTGFFTLMRNVHWLHALIAPTIIVCAGPSRISERKSIAYETDIVDALRVSGRCTLNAEVIEDSRSRVPNHAGCGSGWTGKKRTSKNTPLATTVPT